MIEQQPLFDYNSLDASTRVFVQERARAIHARLKRTAEDIVAIGQDLIEVKSRLPHGRFLPWLQSEFGMTDRHARNFMYVASRFGAKLEIISNLPITVIYELAAPSTPDIVIEKIEAGTILPSLPAIREAKREIQEGQQQNLTSQEFIDEVFPGLQWQKDNRTLGLDEFADPLPTVEEEPDEKTSSHEYTPIISIHPLERPLYESFDQAITPKPTIPESWKLPPEMRGTPVDDPLDAKEKRDAHVMRVMGSSDSPEWYTPQDIIDRVCKMFGEIDTDPCSNSHETPTVPASTLYTKEDDGLSQIWRGRTYLNPPYGTEISQWTDKLVAEYKRGNVEEALALLPARIDTVWFSPLYEYLMCNIKGRIQFANSPYHAPFPCVIVYLGTRLNDFVEVFKDLGPIMRRIA